MQANCPQCGNRITVDDARIPDRPFGVRCPKCQATVRFPGRPAGAAAPPPEAAPPAPSHPAPAFAAAAEPPVAAPMPSTAQADLPGGDMRAQVVAQLRREMGIGESAGRALVSLPDRNMSAGVALMLARQGFAVDTLDDAAESVRLLEQGLYALVVTARAGGAGPKGESLDQRIHRLGPDARRRLFLLLVGDELRSGDGTQAFAALADLVLNTRDAGQADALLRAALDERQRLYQALHDARRRFEAASGLS